MDKIKLQLETLCMISIFAGLTGIAIPQGKMKNAFSAFCAAVIVFSTVVPLADIKIQDLLSFSVVSREKDEMLLTEVSTAEAELYEELLDNTLEKELEASGHKVTLKSDCINSSGNIEVRLFTVTGNLEENERSEIESYLKKGFADVAVKFEEGNNG